jgi:hypothetical protein
MLSGIGHNQRVALYRCQLPNILKRAEAEGLTVEKAP